MTPKIQAVLKRFLRGFLTSGIAAALLVQVPNTPDLSGVQAWLATLAVVGFVGGVTGGLQALDKYFRWRDE